MKAPLKRLWTDFYGWIQDKLPIRSKETGSLTSNIINTSNITNLNYNFQVWTDSSEATHALSPLFHLKSRPKAIKQQRKHQGSGRSRFYLHSDTSLILTAHSDWTGLMLLPNFLSLKAKQEVLQTFMLLQRKETKQEERRQTGSQVEASSDTEDVD